MAAACRVEGVLCSEALTGGRTHSHTCTHASHRGLRDCSPGCGRWASEEPLLRTLPNTYNIYLTWMHVRKHGSAQAHAQMRVHKEHTHTHIYIHTNIHEQAGSVQIDAHRFTLVYTYAAYDSTQKRL